MSWLEVEDEVRYGTCSVCGWKADGPGQLDGYGTCSADCSEKCERDYMARGHNHGPCDGPEAQEECPLCKSGRYD